MANHDEIFGKKKKKKKKTLSVDDGNLGRKEKKNPYPSTTAV
jgi:hypothetical protein